MIMNGYLTCTGMVSLQLAVLRWTKQSLVYNVIKIFMKIKLATENAVMYVSLFLLVPCMCSTQMIILFCLYAILSIMVSNKWHIFTSFDRKIAKISPSKISSGVFKIVARFDTDNSYPLLVLLFVFFFFFICRWKFGLHLADAQKFWFWCK